MIQTLAPKIKRIKLIPFQKENQLSAFLKSRGCNREHLSLQFSFSMMHRFFYRKTKTISFVAVVE